jgi:hypothetical protein
LLHLFAIIVKATVGGAQLVAMIQALLRHTPEDTEVFCVPDMARPFQVVLRMQPVVCSEELGSKVYGIRL